jgi:hypothetical protein
VKIFWLILWVAAIATIALLVFDHTLKHTHTAHTAHTHAHLNHEQMHARSPHARALRGNVDECDTEQQTRQRIRRPPRRRETDGDGGKMAKSRESGAKKKSG